MDSSEDIWKRLIREGKLVYIGYSSPEKAYFEDDDSLDKVMVEVFLGRKYSGDKKDRKIKVTVEVLD